MIFIRFFELTLATLIHRCNKNQFIFDSVQERELTEIYRLSGATVYDYINTIYQFFKPFMDHKMSIFEEYGAFNNDHFQSLFSYRIIPFRWAALSSGNFIFLLK